MGQAISRILYPPKRSWSFIWDAGHPAPLATYPETIGGPPLNVSLFGFAPGGVYHAFHVATEAVSSYLAISTLPVSAWQIIGGIFSVALSSGYPKFALRTTAPW